MRLEQPPGVQVPMSGWSTTLNEALTGKRSLASQMPCRFLLAENCSSFAWRQQNLVTKGPKHFNHWRRAPTTTSS